MKGMVWIFNQNGNNQLQDPKTPDQKYSEAENAPEFGGQKGQKISKGCKIQRRMHILQKSGEKPSQATTHNDNSSKKETIWKF